MLSVGAIRFQDSSALTERVGQGEMGGCTALTDSAWRLLQLAIEKGLVSAGCPVPLLSCANGRRKRSFHLVGAPFLAFWAAFSLEERFLDGGP